MKKLLAIFLGVVFGLFTMIVLASPTLAIPPETDTWTSTGDLNTARLNHTVSLLTKGNVLVAGGKDSSQTLSSCELYDPKKGTWSFTGSMNSARACHRATLLGNGKVMVTGGTDGTQALSSVEIYDPKTGTWSEINNMNFPRVSHIATLLVDGKLLVAGGAGFEGSWSELYDPATGVWTSIDGLAWVYPFGYQATRLFDGRVLVTGGEWPATYCMMYDPATNSWSLLDHISPIGPSFLLGQGKVLIFGQSQVELYDPTTDSWLLLPNYLQDIQGYFITMMPDDILLISGGWHQTNGVQDACWLFDSQRRFYDGYEYYSLLTTRMDTQRCFHSGTLLRNGKVLVIGGISTYTLNYIGPPISSCELYTPIKRQLLP